MAEAKPSFLPHLSVTRPVTVTMCLLALLVIGAIAYIRISVQLFPSGLTPRVLSVRVGYPDATPQESEQQIARPLEETLRTVKGIGKIQTSSGAGGVSARLEFQQDADIVLSYNQVVDRLERLKLDLPEEARDNVSIWKFNQDDNPVLWIGVSLDSSLVDAYPVLEARLQRPLERVDGVGKVELWGAYEKSVMIEVDQERAQTRGVSTYELVQALQGDNFALAGGYVTEGGKKFFVRSLARYRTLGEIRALTIPTRTGEVRLNEVADVIYDVPERTSFQRIDGMPAASLGVYAESGASIVAVCDRVVAELKRMEARPDAAGIRFNVFFNQGQFIEESVQNLQTTAVWGGFFAALVLLFYLRAVRMTLIITLAIPLCVMITVGTMYFIGWSLNLITMMGLMVGLGMVVDNAIVIVENIYRMRAAGEAAREASIHGAGEVALAITTATLTTVVVFLPLMLMSRNVDLSFFLIRIGVPVIVALIGSLFVALLFIPLATERFGGNRVQEDPGIVRWTNKVYARSLRWVLGHRKDAVLIVLAIFLTIFYPLGRMKRSDQSRSNLNDIAIRFYPPENLSLEEVGDVLAEIERFIEKKREAYGIRTTRGEYRKTYGRVQVYLDADPNNAWWYVAYKDLRIKLGYPVDSRMTREDVIEDLKTTIPNFVGVRLTVEGAGEGGAGDPSVSIYLYGDDTETLAGMVDEVERRLRTIPSVAGVDSDLERADGEIRVRIDREQTNRYGVSPQAVGRTVAYGLQGATLPRFQTNDREVSVRLYLAERDRQNLNQLRNFTFQARSGKDVPLSALATLDVVRGSGTIRREDGKTRLRVQVFTTSDDLKTFYAQVNQVMTGFEMPRGYSWDKGERYDKFQESDNALIFAGILAITFVFLMMGVLFESFILPFSVLFSIPFAFLGIYWTLYLTGTAFDTMAQVGVIVLIGVVVNNAIVLVDLVNRLRAEGLGRTESIVEAGHSRFRPILMTTFTTVFGLLPMAVGNSNLVGIPYAPLGRTIMGGLLASTFLTLFVVPLFYTFLDDFRLTLKRIVNQTFSTNVTMSPAETPAGD